MLASYYLRSDSGQPPLRIGLLLDSLVLPEWIAAILGNIRASNFATIELVVLNGLAQKPLEMRNRSAFPVRAWRMLINGKRRRKLLYNAYAKWDEARHRPVPDPFGPRDCSDWLSGVERMVVRPEAKGFTDRFLAADVQLIRAKDLDVILRFGFNIIRGGILEAARYGVWSYHHGDNDWYRGGPPHFWEVVEQHPVSGVLLQVLSDQLDAGMVLCKSNLATNSDISVARNRVRPYWTGSLFVIRKLYELHRYGWEYVQAHCVPNRPAPGRDKIYRAPDNAQMVRFLSSRVGTKLVRKAANAEPVMHWKIAVRTRREQFLSPGLPPDMSGFRWVEEPLGHFYADPFLFTKNGATWMFFEDYAYERKKATIAAAEILPDGRVGTVRTVLDRPYHLSYPLVFEHDGEVFLLPETGDNASVELYRCKTFPTKWVLEKTLFSGMPAWDPTVWMEEGRFWFFVTLLDPPGAGPQLYLFHAGSLTGEWEFHPSNPICPDERRARGAGLLFRIGDRRIRPSQDCTVTYGYSFSWNEITQLTPDSYEEKPSILTVLPDWYPGLAGTHTYNRNENIEVVDGKFLSRLSRHRQ